MKLFFIFVLISAGLICTACSGSNTPLANGSPGTVSAIANLSILDVGNVGNGADLEVTFTRADDEDRVAEYRILAVKAVQRSGFDLSAANAVPSGNYISIVPNGQNRQLVLGTNANDSNGERIGEGVAYVVFVLSVAVSSADTNALSSGSNEITLINTSPVPPVTSLRVADISNNADGSDLRVSFTRASEESRVGEYRILVVKAAQKDGFNLQTANLIAAGSFTSLTPNGQNQELTLTSDAKDSDGERIVERVNYVVFVLSVAADLTAENTLSDPSREIILEKTSLVSTVAQLPAATGGISVDAAGNIFVADIGVAPNRLGTTVYKVTPAGEVSVFAHRQGLLGASGNEFDSQGNLFQSNLSNNTISKITPDGQVETFVQSGLAGPIGIAIDSGDMLYVANCSNNTVSKVSPDGAVQRLASSSLFRCPNGITLADDGNLYVANFNDGNILRVTMQGQVSLFATLPGNNNGHIVFHDGLFYAVARGNHRIFTIDSAGEVSVPAGTAVRGHEDGAALDASFSLPNDLDFSPVDGKLYVNEVVPVSGTTNIPSILRVIEIVP